MTSESQSTALPVAQNERIDSLDILRGVAVFGILLMNISAFGLLWQAYGNPYAQGGSTGINLALFQIMNVMFEGTMRGIFSMLFGAGIVLMAERLEAGGAGVGAADIHLRRMSWLMVFGIAHWALLLWTGEILFAYSLCGFLLFAFRKMKPKRQLVIGLAALALAAVLGNLNYEDTRETFARAEVAQEAKSAGAALTPEQEQALAERGELESHMMPSEETRAMMEGWHSGSYLDAVRGQFDFSYEFQWTGAPYWLLLDMMPFMLIGMALLKLGVLSARQPLRVYGWMIAGGYAVGIPLGLYELGLLEADGYSALAAAKADRSYEISRLAMVMGHLGLLLSIVKLGLFRAAQRGLAAAGQMALTNYIMQTVICTLLFYGFGFGLYGELQRYQLYLLVAVIAALQIAWSLAWLARYRFGPLEWVWRSLTYWKRQPLRRASGGAPPAQILGAT